jgi:hypothetical protein
LLFSLHGTASRRWLFSPIPFEVRASLDANAMKLMPDLAQLLRALFLVALLLYLIPAVFGFGRSPEVRRRFHRAAILALGAAIAIAVVASVIWFTR